MSDDPILLFLHGVGDGDHEDKWKTCLTDTLTQLGYPGIETLRVIAPKYSHALRGWDEKEQIPEVTTKPSSRGDAKQNRRDFERRMGALEFRLGRHDRGKGQLGGDALVDVAVRLPQFRQAQKYVKDPQIRAQVLNVILAKLPAAGRLVIIGHSLGSVIAADLVSRLPVGLHVAGMVTIGSPLANGNFAVDKLRETLKEPPTNLAWWVNFWNTPDLVAARRGVSSVFPWMVDFRIDTKQVGLSAHSAVSYFADTAVAAAIGFALFGSRSKELAITNKGFDVPLDSSELIGILALRYAYLIKMRLEGDLQDRYAGALREVQSTLVDDITRRNDRDNRPMPSDVTRLAFDVSDPKASVPEPLPSGHLTKDDAVIPLTILAAENVIQPFEIEITKAIRQKALEDLTAEMGLGSQYGRDVFAAAKEAQDILSPGLEVNWLKWGALGVGAAALVIATGGLALAAAPGVAGAAVITSALASFGPGGMIGGLLTAGTLVTAGGGGIAYGLASPGTAAEVLAAVVQRQLTAVILKQNQHLDQNSSVWNTLVETEMEIRREHERLDEFSDDSAVTLKELKRKIISIERALKYMTDSGLEPGFIPDADADADADADVDADVDVDVDADADADADGESH